MPVKLPGEPWHSFLTELDDAVDAPVRLDCLGGFVLTHLYGVSRTTADVDVMELAPPEAAARLMAAGGPGSPLAHKYQVYLDRVSVVQTPENYEERLIAMFPGAYRHLRLMALDPYDLALSKLERNGQKDRDDVRLLARTILFDPDILQQRYHTELRWQLGVPEREDLTMQLWLEILAEDRLRR